MLNPPSEVEEEMKERENGSEKQGKAERHETQSEHERRKGEEQRRKLYEYRMATMIDYGSFDAPDVGRESSFFACRVLC